MQEQYRVVAFFLLFFKHAKDLKHTPKSMFKICVFLHVCAQNIYIYTVYILFVCFLYEPRSKLPTFLTWGISSVTPGSFSDRDHRVSHLQQRTTQWGKVTRETGNPDHLSNTPCLVAVDPSATSVCFFFAWGSMENPSPAQKTQKTKTKTKTFFSF